MINLAQQQNTTTPVHNACDVNMPLMTITKHNKRLIVTQEMINDTLAKLMKSR